jgi:hypothetical protein
MVPIAWLTGTYAPGCEGAELVEEGIAVARRRAEPGEKDMRSQWRAVNNIISDSWWRRRWLRELGVGRTGKRELALEEGKREWFGPGESANYRYYSF